MNWWGIGPLLFIFNLHHPELIRTSWNPSSIRSWQRPGTFYGISFPRPNNWWKQYQNIPNFHNKHVGSQYVLNHVESFKLTSKPAFLLPTVFLLTKKGLFTEGLSIQEKLFRQKLLDSGHCIPQKWPTAAQVYLYIYVCRYVKMYDSP